MCSGHGECVDADTCECDDAYSELGSYVNASLCEWEFWSCFGVKSNSPKVCSGHGVCSEPDHCTCFEGIDFNGTMFVEKTCYWIRFLTFGEQLLYIFLPACFVYILLVVWCVGINLYLYMGREEQRRRRKIAGYQWGLVRVREEVSGCSAFVQCVSYKFDDMVCSKIDVVALNIAECIYGDGCG